MKSYAEFDNLAPIPGWICFHNFLIDSSTISIWSRIYCIDTQKIKRIPLKKCTHNPVRLMSYIMILKCVKAVGNTKNNIW